jgi:hypothetical protein
MNTLQTRIVLDSIATLFTEAYEGPPDPSSTWFIDNEPNSGIFGALEKVSAEEASISVDGSGAPGSTIAANAEHMRWSLAQTNAQIRGEPFDEDWEASWRLIQVDNAGWDQMQRALKAEFETLRQVMLSQTELPEGALIGTMALLPHAAFHLGIIRQMVSRVRP